MKMHATTCFVLKLDNIDSCIGSIESIELEGNDITTRKMHVYFILK